MFYLRRVIGKSMLPSLRPGEIVFGTRFKQPKVGDMVIAQSNEREIIKRVAQVGAQGYYLLGDNLAESTDSRAYGWFAKNQVRGVVIGRMNKW